jgi:hypothetical protein
MARRVYIETQCFDSSDVTRIHPVGLPWVGPAGAWRHPADQVLTRPGDLSRFMTYGVLRRDLKRRDLIRRATEKPTTGPRFAKFEWVIRIFSLTVEVQCKSF